MPQRDFLEAAGPRSLTPSFRRFAFAFCPSEASKPPPRLMGRFFRRIGVTFKKKTLVAREQDRPDIRRHRKRWRTIRALSIPGPAVPAFAQSIASRASRSARITS
jgi:hypothetical protein